MSSNEERYPRHAKRVTTQWKRPCRWDGTNFPPQAGKLVDGVPVPGMGFFVPPSSCPRTGIKVALPSGRTLVSVESPAYDSKLGHRTNEMKNSTPPGVKVLHKDRGVSIRELYAKQLPEMRAATTKTEAYDAIEPLVYLAGLQDLQTVFTELPPGADLPRKVATVTPLTKEEVRDEIVSASCWWLGLRLKAQESDRDNGRAEV